MRKKIIFILVSIVFMIIGISYMAISKYQSSMKYFSMPGYVLDNKKTSSGNNKSTVYYFDNNTRYKDRYDDTVVFNDVNGEKVDVSQASFIHYNDDSIGVLKKSVILNLNEINNEIPKYYNIFSNTTLKNNNGTYTVDNLGKTLKFKRFIVKVSNDKYLIVCPKVSLYLDGETETRVNSIYVEVSFIDDKVINIENKEVKYQTIGKDAYIDLGDDIILNLDNRYLFVNGEAKISIDQMIIDSSDNIEIQPIDSKNNEEEIEETKNNNGNNIGQTSDDSTSSVEIEETEVDETELEIPIADLSDIEITANKIEGTIKIIDNDSLVVGGSVTKIIENSTGKIVDIIENDEGDYNIDISSSRLLPETMYNLVTTINYKKDNIVYSMDIVQNVFETSSLGISLEKDYLTSNKISYNVIFDEYSKAKSCNVTLKDSTNKIVEEVFVQKDMGNLTSNVLFSNLNSNTKYSIVIDNILYDDYITSDEYAIEESVKTLKVKPNIGDPNFVIDKKTNKVTLKLDGCSDKENGIESYKYQIFDKRLMNSGIGTPVTTIEKNSLSTVDVDVDDNVLYHAVGYVYNVVIEFYDNEKYIEYVTPYSEIIQIDGKEAPTLTWKSTEVTYEKINGIITINDPGQVVDTTKEMTVVYSNSVGTIIQYLTSGSLKIPFNKNNLRANETYTISIYGTVDFQDDNPKIENYHIGSINVKTEKTKPFNTMFDEDTSNVLNTFTVHAQLLNNPSANSILEATTLTGITFVLHEGKTTSGRVVKELQKVDKNDAAYESDLKSSYYDKRFTINPEFFNLKSSDLDAEYYTIEIKDAYDYTDFKNDIPIENNTITVKANDKIPSNIDSENAVLFRFVRNKDVENPDPDLRADTIVGINYKTAYDNSKHNLKKVVYKIYEYTNCSINESTCKEIENVRNVSEIGEEGIIEEQYLPVGCGAEEDSEGDSLRRGHNYYFEIELHLDLNGDGVAETIIPDNTKKYISQEARIPKQEPIMKIYPVKSTNNSVTLKYKIKDIDETIIGQNIYASIKSNNIEEKRDQKQLEINTDTYEELTFENLSEGLLNIYTKEKYYKDGSVHIDESSDGENHNYMSQYFNSLYTLPNLQYSLEIKTNVLHIKFLNYSNYINEFNKIATYNVNFTGTKNGEPYTKKMKNQSITEDTIKISLFDISEFINQDVTVEVEAIYDTEVFGYGISNTSEDTYYALQNTQKEGQEKQYIKIDELERLEYNSDVKNSIYTKDATDSLYKFTNIINNKKIEIDKTGDEGGLLYNYSHVIPKLLKEKKLTPATSNDQSITFDTITPGISVKAESGESRIIPMISSVNIAGEVFGENSGLFEIRDSKIFIELYSTNTMGTDLELIDSVETTTTELNNGVNIDELLPDSPYAIKFYADIKVGNEYVRKQLYDIDDNDELKVYYFNTLSGVNFSNFNHSYNAISYSNKTLNFSYNMDKTLGFNKLKYIVRKREVNPDTGDITYSEVEDLNIEDETLLQKTMTLSVDVSPTKNKFQFGERYQLEVIPISIIELNGISQDVNLTNNGGIYNFKLQKLKNPFVRIKSEYSDTSFNNLRDLIFVINIYDSSKIIYDGTYSVKIYDEDNIDITPEEYKDKWFQISEFNKKIKIENQEINKTYKIKVTCRIDKENIGDDNTFKSSSYEIKLLDIGDVAIGNISVSRNADNKLELYFSNSDSLTSIDTLSYSIYNTSDGTSVSRTIDFIPQEINIGDDKIYVQTLPDIIDEYGLYYIQTQFIKDNNVIYDGGLEYTYVIN